MIKNQLKIIFIIIFLISSCIYFSNDNVSAYGKNTSLADVDASFTAENVSKYWNNGSSVSILGDVNGDGFDDIAIAKYYITKINWKWSSCYGKVYLIFGKKSGWTMDLNLLNANASFYCKNNVDFYDLTVAGAGDVNNDGIDDFLIGAPGNCENGWRRGKTYLILGKTSGWVNDFNLSNADASFIGEENELDSGASVAGAGDVNNDGFNDFLIGAPHYAWADFDYGKTYLIFGRKTNWQKNISLSMANASFISEDWQDGSGTSVAGAGDVNNDGYDDILIGAPHSYDGGEHAGKTHLIFGKKSGWIQNLSLTYANASFIGEFNWGYFGYSVAGGGNVNGDAFDDLLIGAPGYWPAYSNSPGKTYLILGKSHDWQKNVSVVNVNASFNGEIIGDRAGFAVSCSGDINGDGFDDIIIGAPWRSEIYDREGQTYVVLGKSSGWIQNISLANANASFSGEYVENYTGYGVSSSGDVNNDGYDDILISTPGNWSWSYYYKNDVIGETYLIFYDTNTKPTSISSVTLYSDSDYFIEITEADIDQTVFVKLIGIDGDTSSKNIAEIQITSSVTDTYGIEVRLHETDINTGIYLGSFKIANVSSQYHNRIGASYGETIQVTSKQDLTKFDTILVKVSDVKIMPESDNTTAVEDRLYIQQYSTIGGLKNNINWTYETNASWLNWNASNKTVYGIPANDDVGQYWVRINISYKSQSFDEHNFTLTVVNVNDAPEIIGAPEILGIKALQDYELDLFNYIFDVDNSSDELKLIEDSTYATVRNHSIIFNYPSSVEFEVVKIKVNDGLDFSNEHEINITVISEDVLFPIVINKVPTGENVSVWSNITIVFSKSMDQASVENAITVFPKINDTFLSWFGFNTTLTLSHNEALISNQNYTVYISSMAKDPDGNSLDGNSNGAFEGSPIDDYSWTFTTIFNKTPDQNITPNQLPIIKIDSPLNNSVFYINDTIYFDCINTTDPDGDILEFLWVSNISGILSDKPQFATNLPLGHHQITLYVNDGFGHNISDSINIIITPWNRPPVAIITLPVESSVYNITDTIQFDGSASYDLDLDTLDFYWHSNISDGFGYTSQFTTQLPEGQHLITLHVNDGFYHNVSVSINITVIDPSTSPTSPDDNGPTKPPPATQDDSFYSTYGLYIGIVLIIIIVIIFGFAAATEVGKYGVLGTMVPLYRRLKGKKVLDNETRGMIRGYILANPGEHYSIIKRTLELKNGTLSYHLKVLEQEGLVKSERDGIFKRFFPIEERVPENIMHISKVQELILNEIVSTPGITPRELGEKTGKSHQIVNYHLKKLISANLIKVERLGKMNKYYPVDD